MESSQIKTKHCRFFPQLCNAKQYTRFFRSRDRASLLFQPSPHPLFMEPKKNKKHFNLSPSCDVFFSQETAHAQPTGEGDPASGGASTSPSPSNTASISSTAAKEGLSRGSIFHASLSSCASLLSVDLDSCGRPPEHACCTARSPAMSAHGALVSSTLKAIMENEYTSTGLPYGSPRYTSGAMNRYDPVTAVRSSICSFVKDVERLKEGAALIA
mmetsp:Transcript_24634/g.49204  ORF Transcript_24634/g.49204 Transcript_24634/m.49204 type:complete len:214 (+) Transcript_24634:144-785(+)